jgi:4-diphosphocytidyl-2-C-methyl-D-erythritol kinase
MKTYLAHAKVNIFLKITGKRNGYHEIASRFMKVSNLFDTISFTQKESEAFEIHGDFSCATEQNSIYKAYKELSKAVEDPALSRLMQNYAVKVDKRIPEFAGLGGGSSDAATFLKMCNEVLHLGLSKNDLARVGANVGADVPFFIYDYASANVSGIGEIVEAFSEDPIDLKIITPDIEISTPKVYQTYRENFYNPIDGFKAQELLNTPSEKILQEFTIEDANDLFLPALALYPKLKNSYKNGYFFSGSGSSFFTPLNLGNNNG